jgi:hypothetical protein
MRTKGAKDLKKRKSRKRSKAYKKKHGQFIPYVSKRDRNDPLKVWIWIGFEMSKAGYMKWNKNIRPKLKKSLWKPLLRVDVPPEMISNKEKVEKLMLDVVGYEGRFLIFGFSRGKNSWHVKPVKWCKVVISDTPEGLRARMTDNFRLFRYFFWEK